MHRNQKPFWVGLLVGLIIVLSFLVLENTENKRYQESLRTQTMSRLSQVHNKIEAAIRADFYLTRGLIEYVLIHPNLSQDTFHRIADNLTSRRNSIRNIALAPNNIISFIHPIKGNEKATGLNYEANKEQWPSVKDAIASRKTVVAGPVNLVQGGTAFISRTPIYIDADNPDQEQIYWGLASVVIDKDQLFEKAGFRDTNSHIKIALRGADGKGKDGRFIDGNPEVFLRNPVTLDVNIPGGLWQLAAIPYDGWDGSSPYVLWLRSGGIFLSLLIGFGVYVWLHRMLQTQQKIEAAHNEVLQAKINIQKNEAFLDTIIENLPNMIFVKEAKELRFVRFNKAGEELTGYPREELLGRNDYDLFEKETADIFTGKDKEVLASKKLYDISSESIQTLYNGTRILHTKKIPILDEKNQPEYLLGISEDITERKRTEAELAKHQEQLELLVEDRTRQLKEAHSSLIQSERLATLGKLTATVSHELRNPLGTIQSALFSIDDSLERNVPHQATRPLELAERSIDRCVNIIEELNSYARIKELNISEASVDEWLKAILEEQSLPEGISYELDLSSGIEASFDQEKLRQVAVNLITNAIHALQAKNSEGKHLRISTCSLDDKYEISFEDNGIGMPDDVKEKVFEPLFSTKGFGVGLGMVIVKNIIEQHHGEINIESKTGEGTTIMLRLPVSLQDER